MKKIALINSLILLKILFEKNIKLQSNIIYCKERESESENQIYSNNQKNSQIKFLLKFNRAQFHNKLCPKIIYFANTNANSYNKNNKEKETAKAEEEENLKSNFEKLHEKYPDIESYYIDIFKDLKNFSELNDLIKDYGTSFNKIYPELKLKSKNISEKGKSESESLAESIANSQVADIENEKYFELKEAVKNKPYLFFNKYGDIKAYSYEEFNDIAGGESIYNFFEKFSILNNKTDILFMNEHDNIFLIFLDGKKVDYMHPNFKIFRKIFFNLNFFNIKFFVCTQENKALFNINDNDNNDINNNIFLLKRKNLFSPENSNDSKNIEIDGENFNMLNLTKDLIEINKESNENNNDNDKLKEALGKASENESKNKSENFFYIIY
jgi:hypothetical protein